MLNLVRVVEDELRPGDDGVARAARTLLSGGLALIPTETVYGLGVAVGHLLEESYEAGEPLREGECLVNGAFLPPATSGYRRIFAVKRRELTQTVPWLVSGAEALDLYGLDIDDATRALARAFWPGALTLIVRARRSVPAFLLAADGTLALRCSASPVVAALIEACGCPLATTSANIHGMPAPTAFADVDEAVLSGVDIAIDAGETTCQDASTIVSCLDGRIRILRQGAVAQEAIERVAGAADSRLATLLEK